MVWEDYFTYDPSSPTCLRWKATMFSGRSNKKPQVVGGAVAGRIGSNGYCIVGLLGKQYKVHRIIWEIHNGLIPAGLVIDHIDGDKINNILSNLRIVTRTENCRNRKKNSNNASGVTGVTRFTNANGDCYWKAHWSLGKCSSVGKYFSIEKLGDDGAFKAACEARAEAIKSLGGYTDRHGI